MKRPPACPLLGVTAGIVLCAGGASAAPKPLEEAPAERPKAGWVSRMAAAPKKLAFWEKETKAAPAEPAPAPPAKTQPARKPASSQKSGATRPAPAAEPAPEPKRKSLLPKLPAIPFFGKPAESGPAAVPPDAPASAEKPSWWTRMAAAVTPGFAAAPKSQTAPVPKGLAPLGITAPGSDTFVITKDDSAFYSFGPQQATPPDAYLPTGTVVTLTEKSWGWATVQLPDGRTGMVDRAAVRAASFSDLIPSNRPGDGSLALMASVSPDQLKRRSTPSFILPPAEMPDLPTNAEASAAATADAEALSASLLLPFPTDDITDPAAPDQDKPAPLPDLPPPPAAPAPAAPAPAAPAEPAPAEPAPAEPAPAAPAPDGDPAAPAAA